MKRITAVFVLAIAASSVACMPGAGAGPGANEPQGGGSAPAGQQKVEVEVPKESQDVARKQEAAAYAAADDAANQVVDRNEKDVLKAMKMALGKEGTAVGMPVPEAAASSIKELRGAKLKLRIEPVTDNEGNAVNGDFLQLKDSYTDRVTQLQRKIAEQKASPAEMKEVQAGAKYAMKLNDLRSQVMTASMATMKTNDAAQSAALETMLRVAGMVRTRKAMQMTMNADDYKLVKTGLERQKRAEAIAATSMALLATYQAVVNDGGDGKAIETVADAALKSFPVKIEVTDDEAKKYVDGLGDNVGKTKARYEAMMRKVHGDARYEKTYKSGIDAMFLQAENAQNQKSASQIATDAANSYRNDVVTCKTRLDPDAERRLGPTCKEVFLAAKTGDTSKLMPGAKKVWDETGGAPAGATAGGGAGGAAAGAGAAALTGAKLSAREAAVLKGATAAVKGNVDGMLDAAGEMFPGDGAIGASLKGIQALRKGDAKGAISAALSFVPVPGLKDAFNLASKFLFK